MSKILVVSSSVHGAEARSAKIAREFAASWAGGHGGGVVTHRDTNAIPHLTQDTLTALATPAEARTQAQAQAVRYADSLIEEAEAADVIVIAAPMYNFSIPSTLKSWIDHIARAGRTFRYTAEGPEGLLKNKKVVVVTARGGFYSGESPARAMDFQEPYLRTVLGFVGLTDVTFIHAEGLGLGGDHAERGLAKARACVEILAAA